MIYDIAVIGGGIVGVSAAMHILERFPGRSLLLLEKESALAQHQTGHNSGVIHAGVYYAANSLKSKFCKEGLQATIEFCGLHRIPFEQCGKLLVATNELEVERMEALRVRCIANEIGFERLDATELRCREPHIVGMGALLIAATGIVDYRAVTEAMGTVTRAGGGEIRVDQLVESLEESELVTIGTQSNTFKARQVVVCAGLMADRLAQLSGLASDFRIIPFRGEYYRLAERNNHIVKHLIYPIPDPSLPFLGVHLTRMIGGYITVGPNAVISFAREGYSKLAFNGSDVLRMLGFGGFWRVARTHFRTAVREQRNSLSKSGYAALCRKYCPELGPDELLPYPSGVRAQAVLRNGELVHDFLIRKSARTVHVCNAPSPAATSAIPIGRYIANELIDL